MYESLLFGRIIRPGTRGKAERRLVGDVNYFCDVSSPKEHGDGSKQLFAVGWIRSIDIYQDCRFVEITGTGGPLTASEYACTRAEKALDAIAGFVVLNDASCRDWQRAASQWTAGKNFTGSMPIGPEVVTTDEVDVSDLAISSTLNGTEMQSARTSQMLVSVPAAVEFFSSALK